MYLQLEMGESIDIDDIIGIFSLETETGEGTRILLKRKEDEKGVISLSNDIPKSIVLCDSVYGDRIYVSGLSCDSIRRRYETLKGMKSLWKK